MYRESDKRYNLSDKNKECQKRYREKIKAEKANWTEDQKKQYKDKLKNYRIKYSSKIKDYTKKLIESGKANESAKAYYWKRKSEGKPLKTSEQMRKEAVHWRKAVKDKIFDILGHECVNCGFSDERALQIDHVNGGGNKERREVHSTSNIYKHILDKLKEGSTDYQILCANCNWIKRSENNEQNIKH